METFFLGASMPSPAPIDSLFMLGIKVVPSMNLSMNVWMSLVFLPDGLIFGKGTLPTLAKKSTSETEIREA